MLLPLANEPLNLKVKGFSTFRQMASIADIAESMRQQLLILVTISQNFFFFVTLAGQ
jgi:hypothetical protein